MSAGRDRRLFKRIFKNPCGDSELEIALQVQCHPPCSACNGERTCTRKARHGVRKASLVLPCRPCETAKHRVISNRQHRPFGDVLTVLLQDNIVLYGSVLHDTSHQSSRTLSTAPPPFPPLSSSSSATAASSTAAVTSGRHAERYSEQEGQEEGGERVARDASPRGLNHSNIVRPISLPSLPPSLPPLPLPHDACTYACHRLSPSVFLLLRSDFTSGRVADKVLSRLRARRWAIGGELFKRMHEVARHFLERDASWCLGTFGHFSVSDR